MPRLITFGDSWPDGCELDENGSPYGRLLAQKLALDFVNCARESTSNDHMILQLRDYIASGCCKADLAVFFITSPDRMLYIDEHGQDHEIYPSAGDNETRAQAHFRWFHSRPQTHFRLNSTMLALQHMCQSQGMRDYYIVGWNRCVFDFPGIDLGKIFDQGKTTCAELLGCQPDQALDRRNPYVWPNHFHPNQAGHELIADRLYQWISGCNRP